MIKSRVLAQWRDGRVIRVQIRRGEYLSTEATLTITEAEMLIEALSKRLERRPPGRRIQP